MSASFLQALVSNDVTRVEPGEGVYATYLTPNGRMLADLEIYRRPDAWLLGLAAERAAPIAERLDQSIFSEDVRVTDVTPRSPKSSWLAARAAARLADALSVAAGRARCAGRTGTDRLGRTASSRASVTRRCRCSRLSSRSLDVSDVIDRLEAPACGPSALALVEALRIEAGRPRFGADMTEETIPLEAGLLERAHQHDEGLLRRTGDRHPHPAPRRRPRRETSGDVVVR